MNENFELAFNNTVMDPNKEGGSAFTDDPFDSGRKTKYGITEVNARAHGYEGRMKDLSFEEAKAIYKKHWWDLLSLDELSLISIPVALEVFDTSVNCGQGIAAKFLQRSLNVLNREEKDYEDLKVDGLLGAVTRLALRAYLKKRDVEVLLSVLNSLQGARYVEIAEARRKDERYTYGWFKNRVRLMVEKIKGAS